MLLKGTWSGPSLCESNILSNNATPFSNGASGQIVIRNNTGTGADFTMSSLTYSASITPNAMNTEYFTIMATNGTAFTINNPSADPIFAGTRVTFDIKNSSGGAMGSITWGAKYLLATGGFTNPANTKRRTITFAWDGVNYVEVAKAAADI